MLIIGLYEIKIYLPTVEISEWVNFFDGFNKRLVPDENHNSRKSTSPSAKSLHIFFFV